MGYRDETRMGVGDGVFHTTKWSILDQIASAGTISTELINGLLAQYWKPVYCYLRRKGYDNEQAKDLTQGFFCEIVLEHDLLKLADKHSGRFRTYLLVALHHYLVSEHRKDSAQKRLSSEHGAPLLGIDLFEVPDQVQGSTEEEAFNYAWLSNLLDRTLAEVESECLNNGFTVHWKLFQERILDPLFFNTPPVSISTLCEKYHISSPGKVSNMIVTVKRRFQAALHRQLCHSVETESEIKEECDELNMLFSKKYRKITR